MYPGWVIHPLAYAVQPGGGGETQEYRNGASVYICTCGVVEYRASENVTTALYILGNITLFFKTDGDVSFHKRLESRPELLVYFYVPDESISGK